jgi:hypothetical protein
VSKNAGEIIALSGSRRTMTALAVVMSAMSARFAVAQSNTICTAPKITISPNPAIGGTDVSLTASVTHAPSGISCVVGGAGTPVTVGGIEFQEHEAAGKAVPCATRGLCTAGRLNTARKAVIVASMASVLQAGSLPSTW